MRVRGKSPHARSEAKHGECPASTRGGRGHAMPRSLPVFEGEPCGMIGWEIDWVGATKRVAPGLGPTGRASGPLVHPLFLSPIIIPWPPDVMRTQTSLNGSFSAAQSAEKADRFCDECSQAHHVSLSVQAVAAPTLRKFLILSKLTPPPRPSRSIAGDRIADVWVTCSRLRTSCELPVEQSSRVAAGVGGWERPRWSPQGSGRQAEPVDRWSTPFSFPQS